VRGFEVEQEPFELGPLPSDLPLNGDEGLEVVRFFTEYAVPASLPNMPFHGLAMQS
jgi:hypothetical protein